MSASEHNPYATPTSPSAPYKKHSFANQRELPLASLGQRLAGSLLDALIIFPIVTGVLIFISVMADLFGIDVESNQFDLILEVTAIPVYLISFVLINGYLLASSGQTVGKYACKTRIISDSDGEILPLGELFIKRYLPITLISAVPLAGGFVSLVNCLLIFRENRKCLHDEFAGTRVVRIDQEALEIAEMVKPNPTV